jgi:hypothetical protein
MRGRRALALSALGVLLVLGVWLVRRGAGPATTPAAAAAAAPPATLQEAAVAAAAADALPPLEELPEPVRRLLESTPYPDTSGRLHAGQEDLLQPNRRYERHRPIPDTLSHDPAQVVTWRFTSDRYAYTGADADAAHVSLEVRRGGEPLEVELHEATAVREGRAGAEGERERIDFRRDGRDLVSDLPLHLFADHHGVILLEVRFEYERGRFHEDELRIFHTPPDRVPAELAPVARDFVQDGSLVVAVDVDVERAGFYRFDANVYGAGGEPVAYTHWKGDLQPGGQTIPLRVYGKVLHDAGVPPPYTVTQIRGYQFIDGGYPDRAHLLDLPTRHTTASYSLGSFTTVRHDSPQEIRLANMLLQDIASGIGVAPPPAASGPPAPPR